MVGTLVVGVLGAIGRVLLGTGMYAVATLAVAGWLPRDGSSLQLVKHLLVGQRPGVETSAFVYSYTLLQWLAVYLAATALGEGLARWSASGRRAAVTFAGGGSLSVLAGAFLWWLRPALMRPGVVAAPQDLAGLRLLTSPWQKLPPGPVYLLCYAGAALVMVAACIFWDAAEGPVLTLTLLGRNSLITFVAQYFLYYGALYSSHLPYLRLWPLLFAVSIALLVGFVWLWQRAGGHRLLTVGFPELVAWAERTAGQS